MLLSNEYFYSSLSLGCFNKCRHSNNSSVSVSKTDPAKSHRNVSEYLCAAACFAIGQLFEMSTAEYSFLYLDRRVRKKWWFIAFYAMWYELLQDIQQLKCVLQLRMGCAELAHKRNMPSGMPQVRPSGELHVQQCGSVLQCGT